MYGDPGFEAELFDTIAEGGYFGEGTGGGGGVFPEADADGVDAAVFEGLQHGFGLPGAVVEADIFAFNVGQGGEVRRADEGFGNGRISDIIIVVAVAARAFAAGEEERERKNKESYHRVNIRSGAEPLVSLRLRVFVQKNYTLRKIFSMALPLANSSTNLSR